MIPLMECPFMRAIFMISCRLCSLLSFMEQVMQCFLHSQLQNMSTSPSTSEQILQMVLYCLLEVLRRYGKLKIIAE